MKKTSISLLCTLLFTFLSVETCIAANELIITAPSSVEESGSFEVTVKSNGAPMENVTIIFNNLNETTNSSGKVVFYAPLVVDNILYDIIAIKEGYQSATKFITIINVPQLYVTASGTEQDGKYFPPITVVVYDGSGNLITGAIVTFNGQTDVTVNGLVTFSFDPYEVGSYMITAAMTGFKDAEPITLTIKATTPPFPSEICLFVALIVFVPIFTTFLILRDKKRKR